MIFDNRQDWIAHRAYALWEQARRPYGEDQIHWRQAVLERELLEQTRASADGQEVFDRLRMTERPVRRDRATNILVVEDEAKLRFDTVDLLEEAGYRVLEAATADEALVLFKINQIDTLFTDIDMPGSMDGLGLVKAVRARWPATRIIVTSDAIRLSHRDMESGVDFISKPISNTELLKMMG